MNWKSSRPDLVMLAAIILMIVVVVAGFQAFSAVYEEFPGGNDFTGRWLAAKNLIQEQESPLGENTTEIIYGVNRYRNIPSWKENSSFLLPYFSIIPYLPFGLITEIQPAIVVWTIFSLLCLIAISLLSVRLSGWKGKILTLPGYILLAGFGFPFVLAVWNGDLALLSGCFVLIAALMIKNHRFGLAGVVFAFAAIKPSLLILIFPFVILWMVIKGQWVFLLNCFGTIGILSGISWILDPEWIMNFLRQVVSDATQWSPTSTFQIFEIWLGENGRNLAIVATVILAIYLLTEWVISFFSNEKHFIWTLGLTFVVSTIIGLPTDLDHQALFLLPILLITTAWEKRWKREGQFLSIGFFLILLLGNWGLTISLLNAESPDANYLLYFSMPLVLLLGMLWTRWWNLRLVELPVERWRTFRRAGR